MKCATWDCSSAENQIEIKHCGESSSKHCRTGYLLKKLKLKVVSVNKCMLKCPLWHLPVCVLVNAGFLSAGREADALYPSPPSSPSTHLGKRAVTLLLTRFESINTFTPHAPPHGTWAIGNSSIATSKHRAPDNVGTWGWPVWCGTHWQRYPKSLSRPWHAASQLSQGQK